MSKKLVFPGPGLVSICDSPISPLEPNQILVKTSMTGARHGEDHYFLCRNKKEFPYYPASWGCGEVIETGAGVRNFHLGEWIHGPMLHSDIQVLPIDCIYPLDWMKKEFSVFVEPGVYALRCIHAAGIRYGESVAIIGMGSIGLMALQYALADGATQILAVDKVNSRLDTAVRLGAHQVLQWQPKAESGNIRGAGFDAVIELSGSGESLLLAGQLVRAGGRVVIGGKRYDRKSIHSFKSLREENHFYCRGLSTRDKNLHLEKIVIHSISAKNVIVWPIISDLVPFSKAIAFYEEMWNYSLKSLKTIFLY